MISDTEQKTTGAKAAKLIDSPVGRLYIAAQETGLTDLLFVTELTPDPTATAAADEATRILEETERQLQEYFAGARREFDIPIFLNGTEFQLATWRALCEVPYGKTISYGELAERLERPDAVRAVGTANGANPIAIIVPCHRVIGADGSLTGYGGGLEIKRKLLKLEGAILV